MIVFGVGPAGTGKTYLAMAMAVTAFRNEEVSRIILTPTPETEDKSEGETRENLIYDSEDNSKVEKTSDQKK